MSKHLNRDLLKFLVIIPMTVSHFADIYLLKGDIAHPTIWFILFNIIGSVTAPVMCVMMAKGFEYTRSAWKYAFRVFLFGLISHIPYAWSHKVGLLDGFNMFFTFAIALVALICYTNIHNNVLKWTCIILLVALSAFCEWPGTAVIWLIVFYKFRQDKKKQFIIGSVVYGAQYVTLACLWHFLRKASWQFAFLDGLMIWLVVVAALYTAIFVCNGKRGRHPVAMKWFFYVYYPVHFLVLGLLRFIR